MKREILGVLHGSDEDSFEGDSSTRDARRRADRDKLVIALRRSVDILLIDVSLSWFEQTVFGKEGDLKVKDVPTSLHLKLVRLKVFEEERRMRQVHDHELAQEIGVFLCQ